MANVKITDLSALTNPASTDVLPIVDVGTDVTKKVSIADLLKNAGDGTASAPGIAFDGDSNTGIYRPGPDQVAISTNGTGRLFVDASGNVGVGTSSPFSGNGTNVHVLSTGTARLWLQSTATTTGRQFYIESLSTGGLTFTDGTAGQERMRLDSSGRLGLGTSSPSNLLHVSGNDIVKITRNTKDLNINANYDGAGNYSQISASSGMALALATNGDNNRLYITSAGNVGIGTTSPGQLLDVAGVARFGGGTKKLTTYSDSTYAGIFNGSSLTSDEGIYMGAGGTFFYNNGSPSVTIDSSGNVGIGGNGTGSGLGVYLQKTGSSAHFYEASDGTKKMIVGADSNIDYVKMGALSNHPVGFVVNNSEKMRIDSSGMLLVGTSSSRDMVGASYSLQIEGSGTSPYSGLSILNKANDAVPAYLILGKSRGGTNGVDAVSDASGGDAIGDIWFAAADGTDLASASARITCFVDGAVSGDDVPGRLVFATTADGASSPTERMRIPSSGGLLLNTATRYGDGLATIGFNGAIQKGLVISDSNPGNTRQFIGFYINGINQIGYIANNNNTGVTYNTSSDYRLKENVVAVTDGIARLQQLKPSRFNFIAAPDCTFDGFLAHEVQDVVPEAITGTKDEVDDEGNPVYQGIDQSKLVPLLTAALQEAIGRIETLEAEVAALKAS